MKSKDMNTNKQRVPTRFAPDIRFEVKSAPTAPFRAVLESEFERLKGKLLLVRLRETPGAGLNSQLRRAANEAAALAWITPYPLLLFPLLFDEKAETALRQADRQEEVRQRSREILAV
jgi:hypothetical protein